MSRVKPPTSSAGAASEDADRGDLPSGTMVGEYRVESCIGSGGMGMVFSAVHPVIGKRVAIKVLKADVCNDATAVDRFIDEARIVNEIEHPNIVDIFAFGQLPDGRHYFVMEWLRGESLRERIERQRMTIGQVVEVLLPLVRALAAAHDHGIVHRDLKPDNVFLVDVRGEKVVKLLDFGVAKLTPRDMRANRISHTATGTIVGTPQYLSPEQAKGQTVDHRADIYALGVIAFEALTGTPPFVAGSVMEVVAMHLMEAAPRPSSLTQDVPFELDELVLASLAKQPDERPQLREWQDMLEELSARRETESRPRIARTIAATDPSAVAVVAATPVPKPPRRKILSTRALAIALGVVAAAAGAAFVVHATAGQHAAAARDDTATVPLVIVPVAKPPPIPAPPLPSPPPTSTPTPLPATPIAPIAPALATTGPVPAKHASSPPAAHAPHHQDAVNLPPATEVEMPSMAAGSDDDLLAPGSIPSPGAASH